MNSRYLIIGTVDKPCQGRRCIAIRIVFTSEQKDLDFEDRMDKIRLYRWNFFFFILEFSFLRNIILPASFPINFETLIHDNRQDGVRLLLFASKSKEVRPVIESTKRISSKLKAGPMRGRKRKSKKEGKANWKFQGMKLIATLRRNEVEGGRRKEWRATFFFSIFLFYRTLGTDQMQFLLKLLLPFACPLGTRTSVLGESIRNGRS